MGGIKDKLKRLERAAGVNEPCEVCEAINRHEASVVELMNRLGIVEPKLPPAMFRTFCAWCLRPLTVDLSFFTLSERALFERMATAYPGGTLCLQENKNLWEELEAAFERTAREKYGPHYDEYRKLSEAHAEEMDWIFARRTPAMMYLCRVPGCRCLSPKTEDEWRRNVKTKRAA